MQWPPILNDANFKHKTQIRSYSNGQSELPSWCAYTHSLGSKNTYLHEGVLQFMYKDTVCTISLLLNEVHFDDCALLVVTVNLPH